MMFPKKIRIFKSIVDRFCFFFIKNSLYLLRLGFHFTYKLGHGSHRAINTPGTGLIKNIVPRPKIVEVSITL